MLKLGFEKRIIRESKLIKKYDNEFKYNFYAHESENSWIDTDLVLGHYYSNSKKVLGIALSPIYVAVNDDDDHVDDPLFRVHGRILDGRQRYADSRIQKERWPVVYVYVKDYEDYIFLWSSMGSKKNHEIVAEQTKTIIRSYCNIVWFKKPKEINDINGVPRKENVSKYVCEMLKLHWGKTTIRRHISSEFKNQIKNTFAAKEDVEPKKLSKKDKEIIQLKTQVQKLLERNRYLELSTKPGDEKDKMIHSLERKMEKLNTMIGKIQSDVKKQRKENGIDKTDKDFEEYWAIYKTSNELYA